MKALVVEDFKKSPRWTDFEDPRAAQGTTLVRVTAAALSNLVKSQSNGTHYSSIAQFPFVPGSDGVGRLPDGTRVYFFSPMRPFGSMGQVSLVREELCTPLPADLDDHVAAAIANPIMSSWAALVCRARLVPGETVMINGATGTSGQLAVKIAKHLGAGRIIVTGRDAKALQSLKSVGADDTISLLQTPDDLTRNFRSSLQDGNVRVILDYLWGTSAEALLQAVGGPGSKHSAMPIRYVQIGSISGNSIPVPASVLRSTALELMGSGLGSVQDSDLIRVIGEGLQVARSIGLEVDSLCVPMANSESVWAQDQGNKRLVLIDP